MVSARRALVFGAEQGVRLDPADGGDPLSAVLYSLMPARWVRMGHAPARPAAAGAR